MVVTVVTRRLINEERNYEEYGPEDEDGRECNGAEPAQNMVRVPAARRTNVDIGDKRRPLIRHFVVETLSELESA